MSGLAAVMLGVLAAGSVGATGVTPACFGAAARDAAKLCENPALRLSVTPSPDDAALQPNAPCTPIRSKVPLPRVCSFGTSKARARATVALLGDSHTPAWRASVQVLARAQRWRGLTVRRSSCPFSTARRPVSEAAASSCAGWIRATQRWFARHPEIRTVFVGVSAAYDVIPATGSDRFTTAVAGYQAALDALPASVRQIVVLRDNPVAAGNTLACVARTSARRQRADLRCAMERATALLPDAASEAATRLRAGRGRVIDLTRFFCDELRCFPVVGGALVYKDTSHMTATFGTSLGPYLASAYRALTPPP